MNKKAQFAEDEYYSVVRDGAWLSVPKTVDGRLQRAQHPLKRGQILKFLRSTSGLHPLHTFMVTPNGPVGTFAAPGPFDKYLESGNVLRFRRASLAGKVIRLAYTNPALRPVLMPLLKQASPPRPNLTRPIKIRTSDGELEVTGVVEDEDFGSRVMRAWLTDKSGRVAEFAVEIVGNDFQRPNVLQGDLTSRDVLAFLQRNWDMIADRF